MDEAKMLSTSPPASRWVVLERLAPLVILFYQVLVLLSLVGLFVLAWGWFQQPSLGVLLDPGMVIGNVQQANFNWQGESSQMQMYQQSILISVNGENVTTSQELSQVLVQYQVGDSVELELRARSGHISTKTVTLVENTTYEKIIHFYLPFGIAVFFLGAGLWTVRSRLDDPAARVFGILTASAAFVLGGWFDVWSTQQVVLLWFIAIGLAGGSLYHFGLIFPRPFNFLNRFEWARLVGYFVGTGFTLAAASVLMGSQSPFTLGRSWVALFYFAISGVLFFLGSIFVRRFSSSSPVELEQTRIIVWGGTIAMLPMGIYLLARLPVFDFFSVPLAVAMVPVVLFPISISFAILRYRVINTDIILSRTLMYAILTLLAGLGYAGLISGLSMIFQELIPMDNPFLVGVVVFFLALGINPFRMQVQTMVDTVFFKGESVYRQYVENFSEELTQAVELSDISGLLNDYIYEHVDPTRLHIFIYDTLVDRYVAANGTDGRPTTDIRFPQNSSLVHNLTNKRAVLFLDRDQPLPDELEHERARIALLGAQLFMAIPGRARPSGFFALGARKSGENYSGQELEFLSGMADQAAGAIDRAQVMADKDRRVHEMNVLTRVAQGVNVTLNFDDILELLYAQTRQVIPLDDFNITLYNQTTGLLRHVFLVQEEERKTEMEDEVIPLGHGLEREVLQLRRHIITDDYQQECRNRRLIANKDNIYAWMGVPLN
ncbi:MAG TPA: hypothetical protein VJ965_03295, partial [Anaerolineales bacterium]|nr:hypothetical protein [Anaerolineales bacterium]